MKDAKKFGIIWDQTGVLYTHGRHNVRRSFKKVFEKYGINAPEEIFSEKYRGTSLANQFSTWKRDFGFEIPLSAEQFSAEAAEFEYGFIDVNEGKDAFLVPLLEGLKAKGVPMIVASSSTKKRAEKILEILDIKKYFLDVVSCEDVERHEPATDAVELAAEKLGLSLEKCIVVEDAASGIRAAKDAGCKAVGYAVYSDEQAENLRRAGADLVVRSFENVDYGVFGKLVEW
jgi:HAD superfamily hydrolase (TIGR01509 family)